MNNTNNENKVRSIKSAKESKSFKVNNPHSSCLKVGDAALTIAFKKGQKLQFAGEEAPRSITYVTGKEGNVTVFFSEQGAVPTGDISFTVMPR